MIKPRQFTALAAATVVAVLLAAGLYASANRFSRGALQGKPLAPQLAQRVNSVAAIEIHQGDKTLTIKRKGAQWELQQRSGYLANAEKARGLVLQLAAAELIEPKTANKERYGLLELEDPKAKDAKSHQVRILDESNKPLLDIVLGKRRYDAFGSGRSGFYVRRQGESQTWLASGEPRAPLEVKDWVDTSIFKADTDKIARVTVEHPGEDRLVIERNDNTDEKTKKFKLVTVPEGKKLKESAPIDQIPLGFTSLDLDDVRKLDATPSGANVSTLTLELKDGPTVTFHLRKEADATWISFSAAGEGDAKKRADEINAKANGWEFKLPSWKADNIGKHASDLFETS